MQVIDFSENELTRPTAAEIVDLMNSVWPSPEKTAAELIRQTMEAAQKADDSVESQKTRYIVWDGGRVVAHARTFVRSIAFEGGQLDVLALANVCTAHDCRGLGLGKAVVSRALKKREQLGLSVCLFQTGVVGFYKKFGGRQVDNRFINSRNREDPQSNPWWDEAVMIVPAGAKWPDGTIDLGGDGY